MSFAWPTERTLVMGILNVTPDSFSDGGRFVDPGAALDRALGMATQGADIIDVGGESTRPGAAPVPADEERRRVLPVVEAIRAQSEVLISIDTSKAAVARAALDAGAGIVNDVTAGRGDMDMLPLAAKAGAGVVLMHMLGAPRSMQEDPRYEDVTQEVCRFLADRARAAEEAGVARGAIAVDPGIGFGKTLEHNRTLLRRLPDLVGLGYAVLVGHSRKSFIGGALDLAVEERLEGTLAVTAWAVMKGAGIVRVHDAAPNARVVRMTEWLRDRS